MLESAYKHKERLQAIWRDINWHDPKYNYVNVGYANLDLEIVNNEWEKIQRVIIEPSGNIIGYISANISRMHDTVDRIYLVSFLDETSVIIGKGVAEFFKLLFDFYKFRKINFNVIVGNPVEQTYDKLVERLGGRIVGIFEKDCYSINHVLCDFKWYEIMNPKIT